MKNKSIFLLWSILILSTSCNSFSDALDAKKIEEIEVQVNTTFDLNASVSDFSSLQYRFDNYIENIHISGPVEGKSIKVPNFIPGIYSVSISGSTVDANNEGYFINGQIINKAIYEDTKILDITLKGSRVNAPILFKEIFYCGSSPWYFRNQFYELYNNSSKVVYLDSIYFANLHPTTATEKLPVYPDSDDGNYVYAERIWKFPGNGTDYPLKPGESCVISQFAANHQLGKYCPTSPVDCSSSEFEFNMNNTNYPDQPAFDMEHFYCDGKSSMGGMPQYLTSVFGGAYVIFQIPQGEVYDPANNPNLETVDLSDYFPTLYAKIPIRYVLDGVEAGQNETKIASKRMSSLIDAGMTYVGATYCSKSVARKVVSDAAGNPILTPEGNIQLIDTNNSSDDFDRGLVPMLRRYGTKMPSWNHTLKIDSNND